MANVVWSSGGSTDGNVAGNWNPARVPTTGDTAYFDATSVVNCTFSGNVSCDGLNATSAYSGDIDFGDAKTHTWGASNFTLAHTGATDLGIGTTHNAASCDWITVDAVGAWKKGTSIIVFNGTCTINTGTINLFYNLTVANGATRVSTNDSGTTNITTINNGGTLSIDSNKIFYVSTPVVTLIINTGGTLSGLGTLVLYTPGSGEGLTVFNGTIDITNFAIYRPIANSILSPGNFQSIVKIYSASTSTDYILTLTASGVYQFNSLELETTGTKALTLDNTSGPTSITILGDLTIDEDAGGAIAINDSAKSVAWDIRGDVIDERTGDTFTWTKGTGDITLSGSADQDIAFMGQAIEDIIVNKSAGALSISGGFTTDSFTGTSTGTGDFDPGEETITVVGNCSWAAAFDFNSGATTMNGSTWIVGGNFTADGQTLNATASWVLTVTGTAVASGTGSVQYSNAGAGTEIVASSGPWTDGGNNTNWKFIAAISNIQFGGGFDDDMFLVVEPASNVKILL